MKFRTRLFLLFLALALITNGLVIGVLYYQAEKYLLEEVGSTALSIAATAGALIDGDEHEKIRTREDQNTDTYRRIESELRQVRDANQRKDVRVKFIYSVVPDPSRPQGVSFVVDAQEEGPLKSNVADHYDPEAKDFHVDFGEYQVMQEFITDEWGTWLMATAPIQKSDGTTVAAVCVDLDAGDVRAQLGLLLWSGLGSLALGVALALVMAFVLSRRVANPLKLLREAVERIGQGDLKTQVDLRSRDEFGEVGAAVNRMVKGLRQRDQLKGSLARYVSAHVAERIMESGEVPNLTGQRRQVTILFLDVRGFTTLSEKLSPELVVALLNELFEEMVEIILEHEGFLDKFLGDGLLAIFGALSDDPLQEEHAIQTAFGLRRVVERLNEKWKREQQLDLRIGIGINTGPVVFGHIGSERRMDLTAIGDTVNLAARVESSSKELGADVVVTEFTVARIRDRFDFTELKSIHVKGREAPVTVYSVQEKGTAKGSEREALAAELA